MNPAERLTRSLGRERQARKQAEAIAERTTRELYQANLSLKELNEALEERVRERTAALRVLQIVTSAANETATVTEALGIALEQIAKFTRWPLGHVYVLEEHGTGEVVSSGLWHVCDEGRFRRFRKLSEDACWGASGAGLIGAVLASARPIWIADVSRDRNFLRGVDDAAFGARAAFAFPVLVGPEVVAVFEFYADEPETRDQGLLELVEQIGTQLGRVIERQRAQDQLRSAKDRAESATLAKSRFLANMSHELRTPLNVVIGVSEMLVEEAEDLEQRESAEPLQRIKGAATHLLSLINGILDLSKIEAGHIELQFEDISIAPLVRDLVTTTRSVAEKNGSRIESRCPPDVGEMRSDPTRVRQVLLNLIGNACKFTENGEIHVEAEGCADWIVLRVSDSGIGIAPEKLQTLFDEFSQADTTIHRQYGGTGLGLAISRRLCRLLGGDIDVSSKLGEGSTFTVRLPRNPL